MQWWDRGWRFGFFFSECPFTFQLVCILLLTQIFQVLIHCHSISWHETGAHRVSMPFYYQETLNTCTKDWTVYWILTVYFVHSLRTGVWLHSGAILLFQCGKKCFNKNADDLQLAWMCALSDFCPHIVIAVVSIQSLWTKDVHLLSGSSERNPE